jgi:hypothetical protein
MTKKAGSESGSISQRHGSTDPDLLQNVMDPEVEFLEEIQTEVLRVFLLAIHRHLY